MKRSLISLVFGLVLGAAATSAGAVAVTVQGTADPWLAGMPAGSTASIDDSAPGQSPLLVPSLPLSAGGFVTFTNVTGATANTPGCCGWMEGGLLINHGTGAENGIADVTAPLSTLLGVFLDDNVPNSSAAPGALSFAGIGGLDFTSLTPGLKQVFFIGNGLGAGSAVQQFWVPSGATRLYLGTMDGFEWSNNSGAFHLDVNFMSAVPEPETYALMLTGLGVLCLIGRRRQQ